MLARKPLIERFSAMVSPEPNSGCWLWLGCIDPNGYSCMRGEFGNRKAHQVAYELYKGPIPEALQLDHLCRVRTCVNPDHLEAVTQVENIRRGMGGSVNASKTHCPSGHPYNESNTFHRLVGVGRECRTCRRDYMRAYGIRRRQRAPA